MSFKAYIKIISFSLDRGHTMALNWIYNRPKADLIHPNIYQMVNGLCQVKFNLNETNNQILDF